MNSIQDIYVTGVVSLANRMRGAHGVNSVVHSILLNPDPNPTFNLIKVTLDAKYK
jgi:hypothetical protein